MSSINENVPYTNNTSMSSTRIPPRERDKRDKFVKLAGLFNLVSFLNDSEVVSQ